MPKVQQLAGKFKQLNDDEWFFVLPPIEFNTKQKYELEKELNKLNGLKSDINEERAQELFSCILDSYELVTFDLDRAKKIKIGEKDKIKRVCRLLQKISARCEF
ncbi:MAG: hypothetical protein MZV65_09105 [Chromatiales bacterium]|nr:hypothetical protein [Chromatiales bacterium]